MRHQDMAIYSLWMCLLSENRVKQTTSAVGRVAPRVFIPYGHGETEARRAGCGGAEDVMQVDSKPTQQTATPTGPGPLRTKRYFQLFIGIFKNFLSSPGPTASSSLPSSLVLKCFPLSLLSFISSLFLSSLFLCLSLFIKAVIPSLASNRAGPADCLVNAVTTPCDRPKQVTHAHRENAKVAPPGGGVSPVLWGFAWLWPLRPSALSWPMWSLWLQFK